jgi:hypothetical protein
LQHWENDGIVPDVIVITGGNDSDSNSSESDTSEDKSESHDGSDFEFVQPLPTELPGYCVA